MQHSQRWHRFVAAILLCMGLTARADGLFGDWAQSMAIRFEGYQAAETLTNFPALVQFQEGSNGFYYSRMASPADGADLRFSTADGLTELPHEIQNWNPAGASLVWVRVDQLSAGTQIMAHWGKADVPAMPYTTNGAVWSGDFGGVWHLDEAAANGGRFSDSTSNRNYGVFVDADGDSVTAVPAAVGNGVHLSGDADYATISNSPSLSPVNAITMEAWVLSDTVNWNGYYSTLTKESFYLLGGYSGNRNYFAYVRNGGSWNSVSFAPPSIMTWHHYAATYNRNRLRLYIDGVEVASAPYSTAITTSTSPLVLGARHNNSAYLDGWLDEVRVSSAARSSNWVWACYRNQAAPSQFVQYDKALYNSFPMIVNAGEAGAVLDRSAELAGDLISTGGAPTAVRAFWDVTDHGTNKTWAFSTNWENAAAGPITNFLSGLLSNQTYYHTFSASNVFGEVWAQPSVSFTTLGPPAVTTAAGATNLGYTTATLRGALTSGTQAAVSFVWGAEPDSLTNALPGGTVGEGPFAFPLAGLAEDSTYYYRAFASNDYGTALSDPAVSFRTPVKGLTWTGAGLDTLASNPTNWAGGVCPQNGDSVHFDGTSPRDVLWNLSNVTVRAWNQDAGYTGTVTFATVRPGRGFFTNVTILESCRLLDGGWTHPANTSFTAEHEWLRVTVGGDLVVSSNAWISASRKGYPGSKGPAPGGTTNGRGAAHGGAGGRNSAGLPQMDTYGTIVGPTNHGSSAGQPGGGTIVLAVGGTVTLDGTISALGAPGNGASAGGSLWITAGVLGGSGLLDVSGGPDTQNGGGGGGGRLAVILTNAVSFGSVRMAAAGGICPSVIDRDGAAGTIYRQHKDQAPGQGSLAIVSGDRWPIPDGGACTVMPTSGLYNAAVNLDTFSEIVIGGRGVLGVNRDTILTDFSSARISGSGSNTAYLALRYTNEVVFPAQLVVSNYTLSFDVPTRLPGDLTIAPNGAVSHSRSKYNEETCRLDLTVPGNLVIQAGGKITADEFSYLNPLHPAGGASYGGRGGWTASSNDTLTYGSVLTPTNLGTSGTSALRGGGAIRLTVGGTTTVEGAISARANPSGSTGGSGGSIWLTTGFLAGGGLIDAAGGGGTSYAGGGGRVSVALTSSESFGNVAIQSYGGPDSSSPYLEGAAGTIYKERASQAGGRGDLIVWSPEHSRTSGWNRIHTDLPGLTNASAGELSFVTLRALTNCTIGLTADVTLQDLFLMRDDTVLYLNGHTLTLRAMFHPDWGTPARVVYDGGSIVWKPAGTLIFVR